MLRSVVQRVARPAGMRTSQPLRRCLGDHGGHHPAPPSFARMPVPTAPLHEEADLLWNDGVAPELALDFDAPEISREKGLAMWCAPPGMWQQADATRLAGLGFFAAVGLFIKVVMDPPSRKPSVKRVIDVDEAMGAYQTKPPAAA